MPLPSIRAIRGLKRLGRAAEDVLHRVHVMLPADAIAISVSNVVLGIHVHVMIPVRVTVDAPQVARRSDALQGHIEMVSVMHAQGANFPTPKMRHRARLVQRESTRAALGKQHVSHAHRENFKTRREKHHASSVLSEPIRQARESPSVKPARLESSKTVLNKQLVSHAQRESFKAMRQEQHAWYVRVERTRLHWVKLHVWTAVLEHLPTSQELRRAPTAQYPSTP